MEHIGILSLIPPIFVIIFAIKTRRIFETLILGTILGLILTHGMGAFGVFVDNIYVVLADADNVYLFSFILLFGGFILLVEKSKGLEKFADFLLKFCTTPKRSLLVTWLLGIVIFIDDSLNVLVIGSTMRKVTDKHKIPREMLAYITNSTGASVCTIIPLSSWVAFYAVVYGSYPELMKFGSSALNVYVKTIPLMLYPILAVIIVPLVIIGIIPKIGPMKKAYKRVEETGEVYSDLTAELNYKDEIKSELAISETIEDEKGKVLFFIIPMLILIVVAAITSDLLIATILGVVSIYLLLLLTRSLSFKECSDALFDGMKIQFTVVLIIVGCFMFKEAILDTGITYFIVESVGGIINPNLLPSIAFVIVFCIVFASSTPWALPAIAMAIFMPLAVNIGANLMLTAGAIIAAGVGGAHACLYSDVDVIVAVGCKIDLLEHTYSQLPYCIISAVVSLIGYIALGFIL